MEVLPRVSRCTAASCGMRYPSPAGDPRAGTCPRCEAPTEDLGDYPPPFARHDAIVSDVALRGVLDNIRSALNVGTMLRAADGARLEHLHLCGLTPEGDHPKVAKTSLGAQDAVSWSHHLDATQCAAALHDDGWVLWAIESTPTSDPLADVTADVIADLAASGDPARLAFIVGNETAGVDPELLAMAERHVHLPMAGAKTTLNVGVAFGVVAYALRTAETRHCGAGEG